jgi:DNA replication protein DnaC
VPLEFVDARVDTFTVSPANNHALTFAQRWLKATERRDVFVFGSVGSGKTRLACSLLNELWSAGTGGFFARVPMFLLRLQPSDPERSELFWKCASVPVLVLDDLGAEREMATDFTRRTLLMLYEERGDRGLRTIVTSNKSVTEIGDFMEDERLASRIKGRADVLELNGADWRVTRRPWESE